MLRGPRTLPTPKPHSLPMWPLGVRNKHEKSGDVAPAMLLEQCCPLPPAGSHTQRVLRVPSTLTKPQLPRPETHLDCNPPCKGVRGPMLDVALPPLTGSLHLLGVQRLLSPRPIGQPRLLTKWLLWVLHFLVLCAWAFRLFLLI